MESVGSVSEIYTGDVQMLLDALVGTARYSSSSVYQLISGALTKVQVVG